MALRQIVRTLGGAVVAAVALSSPQVHAQNWDGSGLVRFGVFLQGSNVDFDIQRRAAAAALTPQSASPSGFGVGIAAGYDLRMGQFVIGAEIDGSWDDGGANAKPVSSESYGIDYFATARARLGYIVHPSFMVYGTAGYGALGAEYKFTAAGAVSKKYATLGGFVYGGGLEYDMGWGIGFFEYIRQDAGDWSFRSVAGNDLKIDASSDVFRIGLKFKVGHDYAHDVYKRPDTLK